MRTSDRHGTYVVPYIELEAYLGAGFGDVKATGRSFRGATVDDRLCRNATGTLVPISVGEIVPQTTVGGHIFAIARAIDACKH